VGKELEKIEGKDEDNMGSRDLKRRIMLEL